MTPSAAHSLAHPVAQGLVPLAQDLDQKKVTPGLLGFVVFAVMAVGLWALMKNMGKQMKKIDFEERPAAEPRPAATASATKADATTTAKADATTAAKGAARTANAAAGAERPASLGKQRSSGPDSDRP
ncbi:hypothetical protein [Streptomyces sp. HPF1205]|uniref:hypothetical protein n=1 Tax=Streptomyces sp. HPF1205 TaxID=2873262 RepID=UPI0035AB9ED6